MASVYPKLKLVLYFDLKNSVYLNVFQTVLHLLQQNSQQTDLCVYENQWMLLSLNALTEWQL